MAGGDVESAAGPLAMADKSKAEAVRLAPCSLPPSQLLDPVHDMGATKRPLLPLLDTSQPRAGSSQDQKQNLDLIGPRPFEFQFDKNNLGSDRPTPTPAWNQSDASPMAPLRQAQGQPDGGFLQWDDVLAKKKLQQEQMRSQAPRQQEQANLFRDPIPTKMSPPGFSRRQQPQSYRPPPPHAAPAVYRSGYQQGSPNRPGGHASTAEGGSPYSRNQEGSG